MPPKRVTVSCRQCATSFTLPRDLAGTIVHCSHACLEEERAARARRERVSELVARNAAREASERARGASRHSIAPRDSLASIPAS